MTGRKSFNNNLFTAFLLLIFFGFFGGLLFMLHWAAALGAYALVSPIVVYYFVQAAKENKINEQGVINFDVYKDLVKKGKNGNGQAWIQLFQSYANAASDNKHPSITIKDAIPFLEKALALNEPDAYFMKGRLQLFGEYYERNIDEAIETLKLSIEKGSYGGLCLLSDIYLGNIGEQPDIEKYKDGAKAFKLCKLSIEQWGEQPLNCFQYAECFHYGYGTKVDMQMAKSWYLKSQNLGFPYAKEALEEIYAKEITDGPTNDSRGPSSTQDSEESEIASFFASEINKK